MTNKVYSTLPRQYYTSEQIFKEETQRIFYERWVCVGRVEQIPKSGDYFVQQVGTESLIIVKTRSGEIRAHYNVCRHRGARLCSPESQGHFREAIQCPYHAWTYNLDGKLIGAPHMNEVESFDKQEYPLHSAQVHVWEGFIFINLAIKPQPFDRDHLFVELSEKFAPWQMGKLHSAQRIEYEVQANWKLLVENYSECYHCPLVHPALAKLSHYESGDNDFVAGPFLGGFMELNHGSMSLDGSASAAPLGEVTGDDLSRVYYYTLFPNLLVSLHPDYVMFHTLWPQAADRTHIVCEWLFDPAVIAQPDFDPTGAVEFWDMTNRQDWHVCEITQQGVSSRVYTPGPAYVGQEDLIAAFDQQVLEALGHPALN